MKTWKKLVATENDVEFEYSNRLERLVLAYQGLSLPFWAVFCKSGPSFNKNAAKNLEEWDKTWQHCIPGLSSVFDRFVPSRNIFANTMDCLVIVNTIPKNGGNPNGVWYVGPWVTISTRGATGAFTLLCELISLSSTKLMVVLMLILCFSHCNYVGVFYCKMRIYNVHSCWLFPTVDFLHMTLL